MKRSFSWLVLGIPAAAGCAWWAFSLSKTQGVHFGAVAVVESRGVMMLAYGYAITLLGVTLGSAYRNLQERRQTGEKTIGSVGSFIRNVFMSIDFWLGLCASPLVYALLLRATEGGSTAGLTTIALQNGFCCTVIASGLLRKNGESDVKRKRPHV
jgi:hypothetical protein